ncbi:MAG: cupin domain-containing protein [Gammaproteobacteria bacterium]
MNKILPPLLALAALFPSACQHQPTRLIGPDGIQEAIEWTAEEQAKPIAIRHLHRNADTSTHIVRLKGAEPPHYHDRHDLTVTLLSGRSTLHLKDHDIHMGPGDTAFIPRGVFHWAENTAQGASEAFVQFTPAFDGKDRRLADSH